MKRSHGKAIGFFVLGLGIEIEGVIGASKIFANTTWNGLHEANMQLLTMTLHSKLEDSQGKTVTLAKLNKPIYFLAPWCPFCAKTDKLLIANHLMNHVQIVGVALNGGSMDLPFKSIQVSNSQQARAVFERDWNFYGIHWSISNLDFAMPGSFVDKAVQRFPLVLVPHNGHWYVQEGYNPSPQFWKELIG